jgi:hypothetical protein
MSQSKTKRRIRRQDTEQSSADNSLERQQKIAQAAYYKAEQRGFAPGHEEHDWLEAEKEIAGEPRAS